MIPFSDILRNLSEILSFDPKAPMIFTSGLFWVLFLLFLPFYTLLRKRKVMMTVFVILFSLYFYYKSSGWFLFLLVGTSVVDWMLSRQLVKCATEAGKKICVAVSIVLSLSILAYFKYANFFLWNWNQMVEGNFQPLDIILPVGISFYTFQSISYMVDVYRGSVKPTESWWDYLFFLSFFPALVAGPIVRADVFLPQLAQNRAASYNEVFSGLWMIIIGVIKKAVIADYISQYNDLIFTGTGYSGFESLMGAAGYTMQIYCDFSGYSDMAIGIAMILGFTLPRNFNFPYRSTSLTEFWRRWHISLSTWLRDYLYIPLGGNRKGTFRTYLNNFLTMLIGGLWHGAAWKFVFWGAIHGAGLAVNKACRPFTKKFDNQKWFTVLSWCVTMLLVSFLWIFFRAESWGKSIDIVRNIFCNFDAAYILPFLKARTLWVIMMGVITAAHFIPQTVYDRAEVAFIRAPWIVKLLLFMVVVQIVVEVSSEEVSPFIYFQF